MTKPDKRTEVLSAALELIAEQGFHGAPMAMIASRAGVGAGTIYRYFANKDVLIAELYLELEKRIHSAILVGYTAEMPIREKFIHLGTSLLRYFIDHPLDFRYLEQFHNSPYGVVHRRDKLLGENRKNDIFRELFHDGITRQVMKDLPLTVLFSIAFGPLLSLARDHGLGFIALDDTLIQRSIEACWDAVRR